MDGLSARQKARGHYLTVMMGISSPEMARNNKRIQSLGIKTDCGT
jgi:hypothetical protein